MFSIEQSKFFSDFSPRTGLKLTKDRRQALEFLLKKLESDAGFNLLRELAYVLATIRWETADTFMPIREKRFNRSNNPREWERQDRYWRTGFYGRGYVQITWKENYEKAGQKLKGMKLSVNKTEIVVDANTFVENPDYVLQEEVAYAIAANGMREGWFTGKKLKDYIKDNKPPDYVNARRIINGTDRAAEIAGIAAQFELLLRAAS